MLIFLPKKGNIYGRILVPVYEEGARRVGKALLPLSLKADYALELQGAFLCGNIDAVCHAAMSRHLFRECFGIFYTTL